MFQVIRCFKCEVFQVHPAKKILKWKCKMCNEKQSIKRRYGIGTGRECRVHVQKLNTLRGNVDQEYIDSVSSDDNDDEDVEAADNKKREYSGKSKWSHFVSKEESEEEVTKSSGCLNGVEVVLEVPKKASKRPLKKSKYCKTSWKRNKKEEDDDKYDSNEEPVVHNVVANNDTGIKPMIKFVPPKPSTSIKTSTYESSKWDDFTIGTDVYDSSVMCLDSQYQQTIMCTQAKPERGPPTVYNTKVAKIDSKWEQFQEEDIESNEVKIINEIGTQGNVNKSNLHNMFSLYDDKELDDVLNL